ncbi:hypothetical protein P4646_18500 [Peribacillus simplex]|uniref:hypothetical protein n=1 Tax=Peribacillus simplex TaxID=1478 RepID=UPI002E1DF5A8|nr:hypothetical protein [Peribacillus simplex]MED4096979.1 hypothetical protein [Peribacillus simplex]
MSKTMNISLIFNLIAGVIIIGLMIYRITLGDNIIGISFIILLFVVSYILERNKITLFAWLPITLLALIWSISPYFGSFFFAP